MFWCSALGAVCLRVRMEFFLHGSLEIPIVQKYAAKQAHSIVLLDKNMQALIENPKPFIIPVFPQLASLSLVFDEHFMLKVLPFYEVARLMDSETCQARLEEWEKKHQERKMRTSPPATLSSLSASASSFSLFSSSSNDKAKTGPAYVPSREEVSELLSRIPFFIERETLVQDMRVLFPATQRIPIEVDEDPNQSFMTRLPYGSPNTAIGTIIHMKDYTTFKTTEVVRLLRKTDEEKEASQAEDLEADYQKHVDDMFFYGYRCCMKKHDIASDVPNFPFDDEHDEFLGGPTQGDEHVLGGELSTKDDSYGEQT
ncbi:hypothetical protein AAG906_019160 [Vitis piasezkii]